MKTKLGYLFAVVMTLGGSAMAQTSRLSNDEVLFNRLAGLPASYRIGPQDVSNLKGDTRVIRVSEIVGYNEILGISFPVTGTTCEMVVYGSGDSAFRCWK